MQDAGIRRTLAASSGPVHVGWGQDSFASAVHLGCLKVRGTVLLYIVCGAVLRSVAVPAVLVLRTVWLSAASHGPLSVPGRFSFLQFSVNGKLLKDNDGDPIAFRDFQEYASGGLYPAASFDQENTCLFNFGASELLFKPHSYESIGIPSPLYQSIEKYYLNNPAGPPASGDDASPSATASSSKGGPSARATFEQDCAIVQYAARLCEQQHKNVYNVTIAGNAKLATELNLAHLTPDDIAWRFAQLRQFNQVTWPRDVEGRVDCAAAVCVCVGGGGGGLPAIGAGPVPADSGERVPTPCVSTTRIKMQDHRLD